MTVGLSSILLQLVDIGICCPDITVSSQSEYVVLFLADLLLHSYLAEVNVPSKSVTNDLNVRTV